MKVEPGQAGWSISPSAPGCHSADDSLSLCLTLPFSAQSLRCLAIFLLGGAEGITVARSGGESWRGERKATEQSFDTMRPLFSDPSEGWRAGRAGRAAAVMRFFTLRLCTLAHGRFWLDKENSRNVKCPDFISPPTQSGRFTLIHDWVAAGIQSEGGEKMNLFLQNLKLLPFSSVLQDSHVSSPVRDYFIVRTSGKNAGFPMFLNCFSSSRLPTNHLSGGKDATSCPSGLSRAEPSATSSASPARRLFALHERSRN